MSTNDEIKIVTLPAMRFLCFHAFSDTPEHDASNQMRTWIKAQGLKTDKEKTRIFGFNNPNPSPGNPNYGYDFWLQVGPDQQGDEEVEVVEFSGGMYAVYRVASVQHIGDGWKKLVAWREASKYKHGKHQWLEEDVSPMLNPADDELVLDLHLPIIE